MKRPLLIIIGVIMVVLLIAVWVYVLFFSKPNASEETFTDLNFGNTTDTTYQPSDTNKPTNTPLVDVQGKEKLRQLTTRPVVGYQDIQLSTSSMPFTYYVEAGTGHLFSINLQTGEEKRLSGTTIPVSRLAAITPNGAFVMIQSGSGAGSKFVVGEISSSSESLALEAIDESVVDFKESTTNTFLYSVQTANSLIAKEYDPVKKASKTLFTIPFREAHIDWGSSATATHYFYPKATAQLEGYGYQVVKGTIERLPVEGYGFTLSGNATGFIYSKQVDNTYRSFLYNKTTGVSFGTALTALSEKCTALKNTTASVVCGTSDTSYDGQMPDSWYQGTVSFSDNLWLIDTNSGISEMLVSISNESGREIDVQKLTTSNDGNRVYFVNTNDGNLWLLDRSL